MCAAGARRTPRNAGKVSRRRSRICSSEAPSGASTRPRALSKHHDVGVPQSFERDFLCQAVLDPSRVENRDHAIEHQGRTLAARSDGSKDSRRRIPSRASALVLASERGAQLARSAYDGAAFLLTRSFDVSVACCRGRRRQPVDPEWWMQSPTRRSSRFRQTVSFACGLPTEGNVTCWGSGFSGSMITAPPIALDILACGASHCCGVRPNGEVECWGSNFSGETTPP